MEKQTRTSTPSPDETRKKLKKYARREARAMQVLEQARRDLKKGEQKLTRATRNVQEQQTYLQACEQKLAEVRSARRTFQASMQASPTTGEPTGQAEPADAEKDPVAVVDEASDDLADVEAATASAVDNTAHEQADQAGFDANETVTMDEFAIEEMLEEDDRSLSDAGATRDLADPDEVQSLADPRQAEAGGQTPDQPQEPAQAAAERAQRSTRKTTPRRPRATNASAPRSTTTRRRSPGRSTANGVEPASDESEG